MKMPKSAFIAINLQQVDKHIEVIRAAQPLYAQRFCLPQ